MLLRVFIFLTFILISPAWATTYYVDATGGDDSNTGTATDDAWKTISKVNSSTQSPSDKVLFKRGETWREQLIPDSGDSTGYVLYGAYGSGDAPQLMYSKQENDAGDWTDEGGNIWSNSDATFTVDVGNIIFNNGASVGIKQFTEAAVDSDLEFWYDEDNDLVKLYSTSNPATRFSDVECALNANIVDMDNKNYLIFENLDVRYGAAHGIEGSNVDHIIIRNSEFRYIGGGDQHGGAQTIRWGNAVQFYRDASNCIVDRNYFEQIYDSAITNQYYEAGEGSYTQENIYYWNNIVINSYLGIDILMQTGVMKNIYFDNNTVYDSYNNWSLGQRSNANGARGLGFGDSTNGTLSNIFARNNILFETNADSTAPLFVHANFNQTSLSLDNNILFNSAPKDQIVSWQGNNYTLAQYQSNTGQGANSVNSDPLFLNSTNYSLQSGSPAVDAGVTLTDVIYDYRGLGRPQGDGYDIGAYEFGSLLKVEGVNLSGVNLN